nr:MAG TPA: hypothetical protein [Bacteriophage sp.]
MKNTSRKTEVNSVFHFLMTYYTITTAARASTFFRR